MLFLITLFVTAAFPERLGDYPLQLAVDTAELIRSPAFKSVHRVRIDTKDETLDSFFLLSHINKANLN